MSPLERLNEQVNDAATREADGKCVVIGVTECDNTAGLFARENRKCFGNDSAFHASTTHGTNDFAIFVHGHCGTCAAWARTLNVNNASKSDALACCAPTVDVVK
jgi:hypothetical protein